MRAVLFGLVGAVLLGGAAGAGECRVDAPLTVTRAHGQTASGGSVAAVERIHSRIERNGIVVVIRELSVSGQRVILAQSFNHGAELTTSSLATDAARTISWGVRSAKAEAVNQLVDLIEPETGPLEGVRLEPHC